jgi:hypothetical protein
LYFVIQSKLSNLYFFIQNLSEWHFSCRKKYNEIWKKELGKFSEKEKRAIKKFKKIHLKYPYRNNYLGAYFFSKKSWFNLKKEIDEKDFKEIKKIFSILENKFNQLYKKEYSNLKKWQKALGEEFKKPYHKKIIKTLSKIYNTKPLWEEMNVYLVFSDKIFAGGGGRMKNNTSIECSQIPISQIKRITGITWHETIHICFEKQYFLPLLKKMFKDSEIPYLIKEIVNCSLFPNGILAKKFLNYSYILLRANISEKYTEKILKISEEYVLKNKSFDERFAKRIYGIIKEMKRKKDVIPNV